MQKPSGLGARLQRRARASARSNPLVFRHILTRNPPQQKMSEEWFNKTLGGQYKSAQATDQSEKQPSWRAPTQGPSTRDEQIASSGSYSGPSSSTGAFPGQGDIVCARLQQNSRANLSRRAVNASSAPLPAPQFQESRTIYHRQRTSSIPSSYQSAWPTPSQSAQEGRPV